MREIACILLMSMILSALNGKTNNALIIHNIKHFDTLYSKMIRVMKSSYKNVRTESISSTKAKHSSFVHKKPIYDMIIVILPRSNEAMNWAETLELLQFYDEGNGLLFLSDGYVVQNWRVLLSQYGFDATIIDDAENGYSGIQTSTESRKMFIDKSLIQNPKLSRGIKKGLVYEGGAVTLTPYENLISWSLLEAPENSLFMTKTGSTQIIDKNKMNLVAGSQGPTIKARLAVVGSFKMFSNQFDAQSNGDNIVFFRNILQWLRFETQVLSIKNYEMCNALSNICESPFFLPNQHGFYIRFQIFDEDGQFYIPPEGNLSIKVTKQVLHMNIAPEIIKENDQSYYYKKFGPIENGVYKVTIVHDKPGYYLDFQENIRMINAITTPINHIELFQVEGLPFLIIVFLVMFSAFNLISLTANKKD